MNKHAGNPELSITVGGLPGTGTTTVCRLLRDAIGMDYVYAGKIFRDAAKQLNMDLAEFSALCEQDPAVDQKLDAEQVKMLQAAPLILEGRLSGWLAAKNAVPAFKVWATCDLDERLRRISERDGGDLEAQKAATLKREASEAARYNRYYGADLSDLSIYDLVIDTTKLSPPEVMQAILDSQLAAMQTD